MSVVILIIILIFLFAIYHNDKKKKSEKKESGVQLSIEVDTDEGIMHTDDSEMDFEDGNWEEEKRQKANSLTLLRESFVPAKDNETALTQAATALAVFHTNHGQTIQGITLEIENLDLPDDLVKKEKALKKELNKFYKQRNELKAKAIAIQLAFEHAKLQLQNPNNDWKNFAGLQKLQSNWKAIEYFNELLILMTAYKSTFLNSVKARKLSSDIKRMFELWNSQNIALQNYEVNLKLYEKTESDSDKHFGILEIIQYLHRRYKFNPQYREKLIEWCLKDVELYEGFLKEFHEHDLFSFEQQMEFIENPSLKQKKLAAITFERVKKLKYYCVPHLPSYDVLYEIYEKEENQERLSWLENIGYHIGYIIDVSTVAEESEEEEKESENM